MKSLNNKIIKLLKEHKEGGENSLMLQIYLLDLIMIS